MKSVPNFSLYGTHAQAAWQDFVQFERIAERSKLFNFDIQPHVHDGLVQVLFVVQGAGDAFIDGRRWALRAPCIIVIPARSVHGFQFSTDIDGPVVTAAQRPIESLLASAAPEVLGLLRMPTVLNVASEERYIHALMPLFDVIEREAKIDSIGHVAAGAALMVALFVQIARINRNVAASGEISRTRKSVQTERFRALLDGRCRERVPVEWYANEIGVTAGQLNRLCREIMGMSTQEAINQRVIHEAERELVYSTLSIKQVAAELGFDDDAYFGRFFKKNTGLRPTEFRDMARRTLASSD